MDLNAFREETRDWLESNCPESMRIGAVHFEDAYELYQTDEAMSGAIAQPQGLDRACLANSIWRADSAKMSIESSQRDGSYKSHSPGRRHGTRDDGPIS